MACFKMFRLYQTTLADNKTRALQMKLSSITFGVEALFVWNSICFDIKQFPKIATGASKRALETFGGMRAIKIMDWSEIVAARIIDCFFQSVARDLQLRVAFRVLWTKNLLLVFYKWRRELIQDQTCYFWRCSVDGNRIEELLW